MNRRQEEKLKKQLITDSSGELNRAQRRYMATVIDRNEHSEIKKTVKRAEAIIRSIIQGESKV